MMRHLTLDTCKEILGSVTNHSLQKIFAALGSCSWAYLFGDGKILIPVFALVFLDAIVGVWRAKKEKRYKGSKGFSRTCAKFFIYLIMIGTAHVLDREFPGNYASTSMKTFLMVTEAISILENIGALGWPVPLKLLKYLKMFSDDKKKKK